MTKKILLILNVISCLAVLWLVFTSNLNNQKGLQKGLISRDSSGQYKLTNPILDYEDIKMDSVFLLYENIQNKIDGIKHKYGLSSVSVYFRDLDNGQWIGLNEKELFASASLIKLPVMLSFFRQAETNSSILSKTVTITAEDLKESHSQIIQPREKLIQGHSYTNLELVERMIEESDNDAMRILLNDIDLKYRTGIFESIGVKYTETDEDVMVRVKDYAGFFRVLFNSSYLNRDDSEKALQILTKTTFDKGLVAGVPKGVVVAHKFGERSDFIIGGIQINSQLHDCGIIYYPNKPYILCIMTRGNDYDSQEAFIRDVSELFYDQVDKSIKKN